MIPRILKGLVWRLLRISRNFKFMTLSRNKYFGERPHLIQPLLLEGKGKIRFGAAVKIGVSSSPNFWTTVCYIEARSLRASVSIGENTWINNNFAVISESGLIEIGKDCLIGHDVFIVDSDFHQVNPDFRRGGEKSASEPVLIGDNVFIGSRVTILKGSCIGDGSVVAANSVISGTFPARSLIAGNPGKLMRIL